MFLLDTVVVSEFRKSERRRNRNVVAWISALPPQDLFVSVLTIGEIERELARQRVVDPIFFRKLQEWMDLVLRAYAGRILPVTVAIARRWAVYLTRSGTAASTLPSQPRRWSTD